MHVYFRAKFTVIANCHEGSFGSNPVLWAFLLHFRLDAASGILSGTARCRGSAMCGRLRVGKENLHVAGAGRCSHVFGLLARFA